MSSVIFSGSDVKTLKPNIDLYGNAKILSGAVDPSQTATTAPLGSIYLSTLTGYTYKKGDAGSSTNWAKLDSGAGAKNYIQFGNFETGAATGWSAVGCATVTNGLPVSVGSGAAAFTSSNGGRAKNANTTAPAVVSSGQLAGLYSLNLATSGAGAIGDGYISQAYTIDLEDQAKIIGIKLYYKNVTNTTPNFSGTSANTYAMAIYDLVNNSWIIPSGAFNFVQSSGVGICQGSFQTTSNMTQFQIFIYSPVAPIGVSSLLIDDVYCGPQAIAFGPAMSNFGDRPWTPTGAFTTNTTYAGFYRQVGDMFEGEVMLSFTGAPNVANLSINLPAGLSIDSNKISSTVANEHIFGAASVLNGGVTWYALGMVAYGSSTSVSIFTANSSAGQSQQVSSTVPTTFKSGDRINIRFSVPISGWSTNTVQSADFDGRIISAGYKTLSSTTVTSLSPLIYTSQLFDKSSSYNTSTGQFICPSTGLYRITFSGMYSASGASDFKYYVNGLAIGYMGAVTTTFRASMSVIASCNAGDAITIVPQGSMTAGDTSSQVYFEKLTGTAVVQATESVNAAYNGAPPTGTIGASVNIIKFGTKEFDSHGAYNPATGVYTCPSTGKYSIESSFGMAGTAGAGSASVIFIYLNGVQKRNSTFRAEAAVAVASQNCSISALIACNAGDTIDLRSYTDYTGPSYTSTIGDNFFTIFRAGN